ncbi:MAG: NAD(P)H:quinone oxidoreductase [Dehalococcoidales bacterium]
MKIKVIFYSMYGHTYRLAEAVAAGSADVPGSEVELLQIPEIMPCDILEKCGARKTRDVFSHVPFAKPADMVNADAVIFGSPARFGNMCVQMRNLFDQAGNFWSQNSFVGKVGSAFTTSSTQHGGQETALINIYITLLHLGMVIIGLPYSENRQTTMSEITGGSPYGVGSISGVSGGRMPSENELSMARFQGKHVTTITARLVNSHL